MHVPGRSSATHLLLVYLLHVLVVMLLLQLPDEHRLLVGVVRVLLLGVGAELAERLPALDTRENLIAQDAGALMLVRTSTRRIIERPCDNSRTEMHNP